ncbi:MAG TPA: hypothetical protein VKU00_11495, partial [Chthonomonadaceae bacterium]|nr:hypothetical protein [Chthonomonadaceae bacterium]
FLGELGSQAARLTLNNLPEHSEVAVTFDLFIIHTWDGNDLLSGPDIWSLSVADGITLLQTTFLFGAKYYGLTGLKAQAFPGEYPGDHNAECTEAVEKNSLGYTYLVEGKVVPMDSVYRLRYTFPHKGSSLQLDFAGRGLEELSNESWGITNIEVSVPGPPLPVAKKPAPTSGANSTASKASSKQKTSSSARAASKSGGKKTATTKKPSGKTASKQPTERLHDKKEPPKP